MNQRYQGDGPGGQTRKSAARAKPVSQAASTVHIKKKPQTDSEKRAARKAREKEEERKAAERARRRAEREQAEVVPAEPEKPKGFLGKLMAPVPNMPSSEEYKKWRKRYWILLGIGIVCVAISFSIQMSGVANQTFWMVSLGASYAAIISALIVDFRKVKPLVKAHQAQGGNKTPKQLKHEQESKERAEAIEAARKAARDVKKTSRRRKSSDTIVPGEDKGLPDTVESDAEKESDDTVESDAEKESGDTIVPEKE
jgi:uncharacterized membrane protein